MSEYLILIYADEQAPVGPDEQEQMHKGHMAFGQNNGPSLRGGNALHGTETATSIRPDGSGGFSVTDGAFAETKEALGGYYIVEAPDLDAAVALAKQVPMREGGVEVRPIRVIDFS
jgi:hypothetical protein